MNALESIVGAYKAKVGMRFDKEVAEAIGVRPQSFSNYTTGKRRLSDVAMTRIADGLETSVDGVMAAVNATYVNTPPEERKFWETRLSEWRRRIAKL